MTSIIIIIVIILLLVVAIVVITQMAKKYKQLSKELEDKVEHLNVQNEALIKYISENNKIKVDQMKFQDYISEAKNEEDILTVINNLVDNNNKLSNNKSESAGTTTKTTKGRTRTSKKSE